MMQQQIGKCTEWIDETMQMSKGCMQSGLSDRNRDLLQELHPGIIAYDSSGCVPVTFRSDFSKCELFLLVVLGPPGQTLQGM